MRIGIIFGGESFEHDISIISASIIYQELVKYHSVEAIYISKEGEITNPPSIDIELFKSSSSNFKKISFVNRGIKKGLIKQKIDVLISTMHGINGEDGMAAMIAKLYHIPFVGSNSIASGILMDKYFSFCVLKANKIKVLETKYIYENEELIDRFEYPCIIKPSTLGSSIGIEVASNFNELKEKLFSAFKFDNKVIIQKYIESFQEVNQAAYLLNDKVVLSKIELVNKSDDILSFEDKYLHGKMGVDKAFVADESLVNKISKITQKIYQLFGLSGVIRVDYMIIDGKIYVNEVNTTPGSLAYYLFDDDLISFLHALMYEALKIEQNKRATNFNSSVLFESQILKK